MNFPVDIDRDGNPEIEVKVHWKAFLKAFLTCFICK